MALNIKLKSISSAAIGLMAMLLLCLASYPAYAQSSEEMLGQWRELLSRGNLSGAFPDNEDKAKAHFLLGLMYLNNNETKKAEGEFFKSVRLRPDFQLEKRAFPLDVFQIYEKQRSLLLGSLHILSKPEDSEVYIDGDLKGTAPITVKNLLKGEHKIRIAKKDFVDEEWRVSIAPGRRANLHVELKPYDDSPPRVIHQAEKSAREGSSYFIRAKVTDNTGLKETLAYYRTDEEVSYRNIKLAKVGKGIYEGSIPADALRGESIYYYIAAEDFDSNVGMAGSAGSPLMVKINPIDDAPPVIVHDPIKITSNVSELSIKGRITDNVKIARAFVGFRRGGQEKYTKQKIKLAEDGSFKVVIPAVLLKKGAIEYFIRASDDAGNRQNSGSPGHPYKVRVLKVTPFHEGLVIEREKLADGTGKKVVINIGSGKGVKTGDIFYVLRAGEKIEDPRSGQVLKISHILTGKVEVTAVGAGSSEAKIVDEFDNETIGKGQFVRSRPGRVSGLKASGVGSNKVKLSWEANKEPETAGYVIYRGPSLENGFAKIDINNGREKTFILDKGSFQERLQEGSEYYYRVAAFNKDKGEGGFSGTVGVLVRSGPGTPSLFTAVSNEVRRIIFSWQKSEDASTVGYIIERADRREGPFVEVMRIESAGQVKAEYAGSEKLSLIDGAKQFFRIVSFNKKGVAGSPSPTVTAASRAKLEAPTGLEIVGASVTRVFLRWNMHPSSDVEGYKIYRAESKDGKYTSVGSVNGRAAAEFADNGVDPALKPGTTYYYAVTAFIGKDFESEISPTVETATPKAPEPPADFTASRGKAGRIVLDWEAVPQDDVEGYEIYRSEDGKNFQSVKRIIGSQKTEFTDTGSAQRWLGNNKTYYYKAVSFSFAGIKSGETAVTQGTTKKIPSKPRNLTGSNGEAGQTHLTWVPNSEEDIVEYMVYRRQNTDDEFSSVIRIEEVKTRFNDLRLKDGARYYYKIKAVDRDGLESGPSDIIFINTKPLPLPPGKPLAAPETDVIKLQWPESKTKDVVKYNIYSKGIFSKSLVGVSNTASFVLGGLQPNQSVILFITVVDDDGLESEPSETVTSTTLGIVE